MLYRSYGKLVYEADVVKTAPAKLSENWVIAQVCQDLVNYYQYWLNKKGLVTVPSSWKPHISVVRGENMSKQVFTDWIKRNGNRIQFDYDDELRMNNRGFVWVNCWSRGLNDLRRSLGLYAKRDDRFHLTITKLKDGISYIGIDSLLTYDP